MMQPSTLSVGHSIIAVLSVSVKGEHFRCAETVGWLKLVMRVRIAVGKACAGLQSVLCQDLWCFLINNDAEVGATCHNTTSPP